MKRFAQGLAFAALLAALSFTHAALAAWPEKPIKLVLPQPAGGRAAGPLLGDGRSGTFLDRAWDVCGCHRFSTRRLTISWMIATAIRMSMSTNDAALA